MTFEKFYDKFFDEYSMTDADHDGTIRYTWQDDHIEVDLGTLAGLLTDDQLAAMIDRGAWHDTGQVDAVQEILDSDQDLRDKIEDLDHEGLLRHVFDDIALDDAEVTEGFKEILKELYDKVTRQSIRQSREKAGMTQKEFASFIDIPLRTIENWESGHRKPPAYVEKLVAYKIEKESKKMKNMEKIIDDTCIKGNIKHTKYCEENKNEHEVLTQINETCIIYTK